MLKASDKKIPAVNVKNDIIPAMIVILKKPPEKFFAVMAGKIIIPEIKSVPVILMPATTINAVKMEIKAS